VRKSAREVVAFVLNLWPGLGFYFSGAVHGVRWLRSLGLGLAAAFLFILPIVVVVLHPTPLMNHHFSASELLSAFAVSSVFGVLGVCLEYGQGKSSKLERAMRRLSWEN
jgi:drug/metabolite transporter (DMT)-like permease